jgi:hypothetical protein
MLDADQWFAHAFFKDAAHADDAVRKLLDADFDADHIGVLMVRGQDVQELPMRHKTMVPHGAVLGALVGAAAGALTLSGIGVVAAGPLLVALQGAAAGTAMGTLAGTLGGLGFWREEVDFPADAFEAGAVLVGVVTNLGRGNEARRLLASAGAEKTYLSTKAEAVQAAQEKGQSSAREAAKRTQDQRAAAERSAQR